LQRNALIALGHYKDKTAIPEMISVMKEDPRPVIRGTAAWALGKIGTVEAFRAIEAAMENEKDDQVLFEMEKGLEFKYKS
jgi:epoxyqueuosine reductase